MTGDIGGALPEGTLDLRVVGGLLVEESWGVAPPRLDARLAVLGLSTEVWLRSSHWSICLPSTSSTDIVWSTCAASWSISLVSASPSDPVLLPVLPFIHIMGADTLPTTQYVVIRPLPLTSMTPLGRNETSLAPCVCAMMFVAAAALACMRPFTLLLSILEATLTVSPNRQNLGLVVPTTLATTGPVCRPTLIWTAPIRGYSSSICVLAAASRQLIAKRDMRAAWSLCTLTRLVTAM
mmetsp:Transcript_47294/g.114971  ORF Transcript_47294/g.114971 Transcript_47294/m.114971 type:complete len:237 (-) Transcript_47294:2231-2941(-)